VETLIIALIKSWILIVFTSSIAIQSPILMKTFSSARLGNMETLIIALIK
jgi:hypothetical protein